MILICLMRIDAGFLVCLGIISAFILFRTMALLAFLVDRLPKAVRSEYVDTFYHIGCASFRDSFPFVAYALG